MSAFIFNERMQTLSQRVGQVNATHASTPEGDFIKIGFFRWQFWVEKGHGEWDDTYVSIGDARELAYTILAEIGKVGKEENADSGTIPTTAEASSSPGDSAKGLSVSSSG